MTDSQWFVDQYDSYVERQGDDGSVLEKSRDYVAHAYADAVEAGWIGRLTVDLVVEGRNAFDRLVGPVRDRRRSGLRADMGHLHDALNGDTILGRDDPILSKAFLLGDGRDKTLRMWAVEDWQMAVRERYQNAATVTIAAAGFDTEAQQIIDAMQRQGARVTGDLFS